MTALFRRGATTDFTGCPRIADCDADGTPTVNVGIHENGALLVGPMDSIQAAIDAATDCGTLILVEPGTYTESLVIDGKDVSIIGAGAGQTFIDGGGMQRCLQMDNTTSQMLIQGVQFRGGSAAGSGGAILMANAEATFRDCIFFNNDAHEGGAISASLSTIMTLNCTFEQNTTADPVSLGGGAIHANDSSLIARDCTFTDNFADSAGGAIYLRGSQQILEGERLTFTLNEADDGGAIYVESGAALMLDDCTLLFNTADDSGGAIGMLSGTLDIRRSTISSNLTFGSGGGISDASDDSTITSCVIAQNRASERGGGLYFTGNNQSIMMTNTRISRNEALLEAYGVYVGSASMNAAHCTIAFNEPILIRGTSAPGHEVLNNAGSLFMINCIVGGGSGGSIEIGINGTADVTYTNTEEPFPGEGNTSLPPLFVDEDGPDDIPGTPDDDFRLRATSPCVDAGLTLPPGLGIDFDIDGRARVVNASADMGAWEFPCFGDANGDGVVNFIDLDLVLGNWATATEPGENGDVTYNGSVNFGDLDGVLSFWGVVCE